MIVAFAIEVVKGILTKTQTITYKSGKTVKRIYASVHANVPEDVMEMPTLAPLPDDEVHNMEYAQYAYMMRG